MCVFVCPVCIKVIGDRKILINVVNLFIEGVCKESKQFKYNLNKHTEETCFNGFTGVIGNADSEYDIVNNMW